MKTESRISLKERFEGKIMPLPWSGCWAWVGSCATKNGYGRIGSGGWHGKNLLAHRVSYETYIGKIPAGMKVLHKCDVPNCVNPNHLFLGTQKQNVEDMVRKGRAIRAKGEKCGASKITSHDVGNIRSDLRSMAKIAKDFGISSSQVFNIKHKRHWRHV